MHQSATVPAFSMVRLLQAGDLRLWELAGGLEPPTCCLQDSGQPSIACWRVLSLQLRSGGSSSQYAPVGPSSARWNDCETAQWFGDDPAPRSVAVGVTLGMTDPGGVMRRTCPPTAAGIGPVRRCWPDQEPDRPRQAGVSRHRPAVRPARTDPPTSSPGEPTRWPCWQTRRTRHRGRHPQGHPLRRGRPGSQRRGPRPGDRAGHPGRLPAAAPGGGQAARPAGLGDRERQAAVASLSSRSPSWWPCWSLKRLKWSRSSRATYNRPP
jgi:hypothetical protein